MSDDARFERFVREHSASLMRTAALLTGNRHAAEELLQDTLTMLYPRWERVAAADEPVAYVRRSLTNRFISRRRAASARDVALWELPDGWDGTDLSETVAARRTVWQLLGTLPERQRAAIVLRHFHDLPEVEIAGVPGTAYLLEQFAGKDEGSVGPQELYRSTDGRHWTHVTQDLPCTNRKIDTISVSTDGQLQATCF